MLAVVFHFELVLVRPPRNVALDIHGTRIFVGIGHKLGRAGNRLPRLIQSGVKIHRHVVRKVGIPSDENFARLSRRVARIGNARALTDVYGGFAVGEFDLVVARGALERADFFDDDAARVFACLLYTSDAADEL